MKKISTLILLYIKALVLAAQPTILPYDIKWPHEEGFFIIQKRDKLGLMNDRGVILTPIEYDKIYKFCLAGFAKVVKGDKVGYIYKSGTELVNCNYDRIYERYDCISRPSVEEVDGVSTESIQAIFSPVIENDLILVEKNNKVGMVNMAGKEVIPVIYNYFIGNEPYNQHTRLSNRWRKYTSGPGGLSGLKGKYDVFFENGVAAFVKGGSYLYKGKIGFVDVNGKELTLFIYDDFITFYDKETRQTSMFNKQGNITVIKNGLAGLFDKQGRILIPVKYDPYVMDENNFMFYGGLAKVYKNGLVGWVDRSGKEVIKPTFKGDEVCPQCFRFKENIAIVKKDGLYGLINLTGKSVTEVKYKEIYFISNGFAIAANNDEIFYVDVISGAEYFANDIQGINLGSKSKITAAKAFTSDGTAIITINNKSNYLINNQFKSLAKLIDFGRSKPYIYEENMSEYNIGMYGGLMPFIDKKGNIYYVNTKGKRVIELDKKYRSGYFGSGMTFIVDQKDRLGFINVKGKVVVECQYDFDYSIDYQRCGWDFNWWELKLNEKLIPVKMKNKYGYIDKKGKIIISFRFDCAKAFRNGKAEVIHKGVNRIIDIEGKFQGKGNNAQISDKTEEAGPSIINNYLRDSCANCSENYASIKLGYDFFTVYVDKDVIPLKYFDIYNKKRRIHNITLFSDYKMEKVIGGFFVNPQGELLFDQIFEGVAPFIYGKAGVKKNGKWGFINESNETVIPFVYDSVQIFIGGIAAVNKGNGWYMINSRGDSLRIGYPRDILNVEYITGLVFYANKKPPDPYDVKRNPPYRKHYIYKEFPIPKGRLSMDLNLVGFKGIDGDFDKIGRMGFIFVTKEGRLAFPFYFQNADRYRNGIARVQNTLGKTGCINVKGEEKIPIIYDEINTFLYTIDGKRGFLKKYIIAKLGDKYAVYTTTGKEIIPPEYDYIHDWYSAGDAENMRLYGKTSGFEMIFVGKDGRKFYINLKGECIKDCP